MPRITTVNLTKRDAMNYLDPEISLSAEYPDGHTMYEPECTAPWGLDPSLIMELAEEHELVEHIAYTLS